MTPTTTDLNAILGWGPTPKVPTPMHPSIQRKPITPRPVTLAGPEIQRWWATQREARAARRWHPHTRKSDADRIADETLVVFHVIGLSRPGCDGPSDEELKRRSLGWKW